MTSPHPLTQADVATFAEVFARLSANVESVLLGKGETVRLALTALFAEGHVLLEDVPGVGKTTLARAIAASVHGEWRRIQFTPDLLPSDVSGVTIFNQANRQFEFHRGPVFANIVIADEINRASPKTQSALLEVMEERYVTIDGVRHPVPRPFLVVATQNPVEMDGTYRLPEAQLDRFLMKLSVGYPSEEIEIEVLRGAALGRSPEQLAPAVDTETVATLVGVAQRTFVADALYAYAVRLATATRKQPEIRVGVSPRGVIALTRAAQVYALASGRGYVIPEDIQALVLPVFAHRVLLAPDAQMRGRTATELLTAVVEATPAPMPVPRRDGASVITARGVALALGGVALIAVGFVFGYPQLVVIGASAALVVFGAVLLVAWRPRLRVLRTAEPDRVQRGDDCHVALAVTNSGRLRGGRMAALDRCGPADVPVELPRLRAGASEDVRYAVPTARRGVLDLGPLRISRRDPLGLAGVEASYGETARVWVHPKVHPVRAVPAGVTRSMEGRLDAGSHGNLTFHALREYVIGDDLRHVHWRTSAKVGDLMVRENVDTSLPRLLVVLDDRATAHTDESFEGAVEAAASIAAAAVREGLHIELRPLGGGGLGGHESVTPLLDLLAEATLRHGVDARLATEGFRQRRLGDTLIFLTGAVSRDLLEPVAALRGVYPSVVVGTFGATTPGVALPGMLTIAASDGAEFAASWDGVRSW